MRLGPNLQPLDYTAMCSAPDPDFILVLCVRCKDRLTVPRHVDEVPWYDDAVITKHELTHSAKK